MTNARFEVVVSEQAGRDIAEILEWSAAEFGEAAAGRYGDLIAQALIDLGTDPERPGSTTRPELMIDAARTYHLVFSRSKTARQRVKSPRHFILYRHRVEGVIEVSRILHDSRDLVRHLPDEYGV